MQATRIGRFLPVGEFTGRWMPLAPVVTIFLAFAVLGLIASLTVRTLHARSAAEQQQQSAAPQPETHQATAAQSPRLLGSDAGIVLNFIKPDKTADFEAVIAKLREALQKSEKPERKRQAVGWKVFRAQEPGANGSVLYVFVIDPALKGADYTVSTILAEAFPNDVQALYEQYAGAYAAGQNIVNLTSVTTRGQ